jgi:hypothetical protein
MCLKNDHAWKTWGFSYKKEVYYQKKFYVKCYCDSDIVKGEHCNDKDSKEEEIDG